MKHSRRLSALRRTRLNRLYAFAREHYAALGVDVNRALKTLARIPISLHCWQGDDVYMRITKQPVGYLINFGHKVTLEWKWLILSELISTKKD